MLGSPKKSGICLLGAGARDSGPLVSVRSGALGTVVGNCACGSRGARLPGAMVSTRPVVVGTAGGNCAWGEQGGRWDAGGIVVHIYFV